MNIKDIKKSPECDVITAHIYDRYRKGLYSLNFITGNPGSGKSSCCFRLQELTAKKFPNKIIKTAIIESLIDLVKFTKEADETQVNIGIVEEVSVLFPSKRAMSEESVALGKVLDTCRKKKIILFANAPIWTSIDSHMKAMGTMYLETKKVFKQEAIVIGRFYRLQTNPQTGKVYFHTLHRNGLDIKLFYCNRPNEKLWIDYEKGKDKFMNNLYNRLLIRAEKKLAKENKELGITPKAQVVKPLTQKEMMVYDLRNKGLKHREIGAQLGVTASRIGAMLRHVHKKLNFV